MNTCRECRFFDDVTSFCRANPPQPVVVPAWKNGNDRPLILTKYPIIIMPDRDWCGLFQRYDEETLIEE